MERRNRTNLGKTKKPKQNRRQNKPSIRSNKITLRSSTKQKHNKRKTISKPRFLNNIKI